MTKRTDETTNPVVPTHCTHFTKVERKRGKPSPDSVCAVCEVGWRDHYPRSEEPEPVLHPERVLGTQLILVDDSGNEIAKPSKTRKSKSSKQLPASPDVFIKAVEKVLLRENKLVIADAIPYLLSSIKEELGGPTRKSSLSKQGVETAVVESYVVEEDDEEDEDVERKEQLAEKMQEIWDNDVVSLMNERNMTREEAESYLGADL